jgi:hypothetical protein
MKLSKYILPAFALSVGGMFLIPASQEANAFTTLGGNLNLAQRDFRVYNNFTGASDNNNQVPDTSFPGYQGAMMAIWKGSVEWGSLAHGDGTGDPNQAVIGSGGANFDPSFQGDATQVGGTNGNTHSEISGSNGGVLAYCETPIADGWRIRYYQGWAWSDGPGSPGGSTIDLQEVATHEYGHGLGLGHSQFNAATMYPSYSGGTSGRSIHSDDIAGVQFVYNVMNPLKPIVTGVSVSGSTITINGSGFNANNNEVWFTQAGMGGTGDPVKVTNVTSNGTTIAVTIPGAAGPGDVLVRRDGTGNGALSNAWPSDLISGGSCSAPVNYCSANPNSAGMGAGISHTNDPSLSANNFELVAFGMPTGKPGLFFYGASQQNSAFGEGRLCISGSIQRLAVQVTDAFGTATNPLDFTSAPFNGGSGAAVAGSTHNFQFWFRDPGFGSAGFNTTDGLSVTYCN